MSPAYAWQLGRAGAGWNGDGASAGGGHATRHGRFLGRRTAPRSSRSVPRAAGRTDGRLGGSGIHPSIHPSNGPTHPTRAPPQSSNQEFDAFHSAQHATTSTHAVRARRSHVLMPPPPGRVSPLPPSLSCPVLSCAAGRPLQSSPPPAASFSGARPQKLAERRWLAALYCMVLVWMDGAPGPRAKQRSMEAEPWGTAQHTCVPRRFVCFCCCHHHHLHMDGRSSDPSILFFHRDLSLAQRQTMLLCASHPTLIMNFLFP